MAGACGGDMSGATSTAAGAGGSGGAIVTMAASRNCRIQLNSCDGLILWLRAISETTVSSASASPAIAIFVSSGRLRRRLGPVRASIRRHVANAAPVHRFPLVRILGQCCEGLIGSGHIMKSMTRCEINHWPSNEGSTLVLKHQVQPITSFSTRPNGIHEVNGRGMRSDVLLNSSMRSIGTVRRSCPSGRPSC